MPRHGGWLARPGQRPLVRAGGSPPLRLLLLSIAMTLPMALAQSSATDAGPSCMSPAPGQNQQLYSACLSLASQFATLSLPSNGAPVVLTTMIYTTSTGAATGLFGSTTGVVSATSSMETSVIMGSLLTSLPTPTSTDESSSQASSSGLDTSASGFFGSSSSGFLGSSGTSGASGSSGFGASSTSGVPSSATSGQAGPGATASMTGTSGATGSTTSSGAGAASATTSPELTNNGANNSNDNYRDRVVIPVAVVCTVVPVLLILLAVFCCLAWRKKKKRNAAAAAASEKAFAEGSSTAFDGGAYSTGEYSSAAAGTSANGHAIGDGSFQHNYGVMNPYSEGGAAATAGLAGAGAVAAGGMAGRQPNGSSFGSEKQMLGSDFTPGHGTQPQPVPAAAAAAVMPTANDHETQENAQLPVRRRSRFREDTSNGIGLGAESTNVSPMAPAPGRDNKGSSNHSRSSSAKRLPALSSFIPMKSGNSSRRGSRGAANATPQELSSRTSISDRPPTLPELGHGIGSGTWFDTAGDDQQEEQDQDLDRVASSVYDAASIDSSQPAYGTAVPVTMSNPRAQSNLRPGSAHSNSRTEGVPLPMPRNTPPPMPRQGGGGLQDPFQTPPRTTSASTSSDMLANEYRLAAATSAARSRAPTAGSSQSSSSHPSAMPRQPPGPSNGSGGDDSLFGSYRPPTPYDETAMRRHGASLTSSPGEYTPASAVGDVVQGPYSRARGQSFSRPVAPPQAVTIGTPQSASTSASTSRGVSAPSPAPRTPPPPLPQPPPATSTSPISPGLNTASAAPAPVTPPRSVHRMRSPSQGTSPTAPATYHDTAMPPPPYPPPRSPARSISDVQRLQVLHYPSQEEARRFDFGNAVSKGPGQ